jgi:DNA polymerase III sliding clamp (beta) subunit (PCNA family)
MSTNTLTKQQVTVSVPALNDLLLGATIAVDSSRDAMARLNNIYLSATSGKLTASATDRYRLVSGTIQLDDGDLSESAILLADVKRIQALIKPYIKFNYRLVTIDKDGTTLTITLDGNTLIIHTLDYNFPPYAHMMSTEFSPLPSVGLNLSLLASLDKVPHDIKQPVTLNFTSENKAIQINMSHDLITWDILLMPMRTIK